MSYGPLSVFSDTIASGASTSAGANLTQGWKSIVVQVPTMSTAAAISVQSSVDGSVWYPLFHPTQNSSTVGTQLAVISASVGSGGGFTPLPAGGLKYVRFIAGAVISGGVSFKLVCSN